MGIRGEKQSDGPAMDRSPHWGRERAVKKEVTEGFRDPTGQETPAEETMRVIRTAAETNMVSVVDDPEQRLWQTRS